MDGSGLGVLAVGLVLCFFGVRSLHLAVATSGFALGWLVAEPLGASVLTAFLIAVGAAVAAWVLAVLVFRTALFFVGAMCGGVIGAKLFGLLQQEGGSVVLAVLFVLASAFIVGIAVQRFRHGVLALACALGGAGLALSGLARTFPEVLGFLRYPQVPWETLVATAGWLALAGVGWAVQQRVVRDRQMSPD
ncbi:hypothetical protein ACU61A_23885 [Pseudonocardia sichuanensis]|uniref:DUF4203 domain-containing protein n=1 Tax=Pseudonocardia kunmingensis TaxID=630975 RepID=A0A543DWB2_9PSEU|nr:DUF4203 domain-containing protein [Pseudonocardia kunmingensis]TQM13618.1 hypothetical protein FB558_0371 [Pseudonocardia kunmingensis]